MKFRSTQDSVIKGEVSLLAALESLIAISISIYIISVSETVFWLLLSICVAPLLLLRTKYSENMAILLFEKVHDKTHVWMDEFDNYTDRKDLPKVVLVGAVSCILFYPVLLSIPIKIYSVLKGLQKYPKKTLSSIPKNWYRQCLVTDMAHRPEVLPGYERKELSCEIYKLSSFSLDNYDGARLWGLLVHVPILVFTYLPTLAYRWSIKSTAIVYFPFVWVVSPLAKSSKTLIGDLKNIKLSEVEKLARAYAWFVIFFLTIIPLVFYSSFQETINYLINEAKVSKEIVHIWFPESLSFAPWHIARTIGAILTISLFLYADIKLRELDENGDGSGVARVRYLLITRKAIALYTTVCGIYILATSVHFPEFSSAPFPWME